MLFLENVDAEICLDVDDIFAQMDDDEKREMADLLNGFNLFEDEYQRIFTHLHDRFNISELELKLKAAGLLPEIF